MQPLISIITVNYNHGETTLEFLKSVKEQNYSNYEVILVDNASKNFDSRGFRELLPDIKIIENKTNLGFAAANNQGMMQASGEFLFFLNFDVLLAKDTLEQLVNTWGKLKEPGILCPVLVFEEAPDKIQYAGYSEINRFTGRNDDKMYGKPTSKLGKEPYTTGYAHGAAIFTSRANIALTGGMPEQYFLYYEEMEWSELFLSKGKHIYIAPSIKIIHKESVSVGKHNPLKTFYLTRNRILFMKRNRKPYEFLIFWLYWTLFALPLKCIISLIKLDFKILRAYFAGTFWHIKKAFSL